MDDSLKLVGLLLSMTLHATLLAVLIIRYIKILYWRTESAADDIRFARLQKGEAFLAATCQAVREN